jgi:hypothetical protein
MLRSMLLVLATVAFFDFANGDQALAQTSGAGAAQQQPIIELRYGQHTPTPGFARMRSLSDRERDTYVAADNIVSDAGIERVHAKQTADGLLLDVELSEVARARLADATRTAGGRKIAVLVKSRLVGAVPVVSPIASQSRRITISLRLPPSVAAEAAASIAARWPRSQ